MSASQWWVSTDQIGKPGSPKIAGGHERSGGCGWHVQTFLNAVDGATS